MIGLKCYKSDKNQRRFATISNNLNFLQTVPDGLPTAVLINLLGSFVFSVQDHCTMALRSLRCITFSS